MLLWDTASATLGPSRWTSEDPIGFGAGDANLNRYVGNQPTGHVDPHGLAPRAAAGARVMVQGGAGAAGAAAAVGTGAAVGAAGIAGYKIGEAAAPYSTVPVAIWITDTIYGAISDASEGAYDDNIQAEIDDILDQIGELDDKIESIRNSSREQRRGKGIGEGYDMSKSESLREQLIARLRELMKQRRY